MSITARPVSAHNSTHAGASDLRMLAQVEKWMAAIRRNQPRAAEPTGVPALTPAAGGNRAGRSQNKSAEIGVFGEIADVLMHVGGVDLDCLPGAVGRAEGNIVEHALHHSLQAPSADILDA